MKNIIFDLQPAQVGAALIKIQYFNSLFSSIGNRRREKGNRAVTGKEEKLNVLQLQFHTLEGPLAYAHIVKLLCGSRKKSTHNTKKKGLSFGICCKQGKVKLPPLKKPPTYLEQLLRYDGRGEPSNHRHNIRYYNSMFLFTSMGGHIDHEINRQGGGPYVFRLNGQNYHQIGTLLPKEESNPKFAQLYIYDTENKVQNRIRASTSKGDNQQLDKNIVTRLLEMLDENNNLVKTFRMARDRFKESDLQNVKICLIGERRRDGRQYNLPTASKIAALILEDQNDEPSEQDIIVEDKDKYL
ncbi:hypothetical protein U9M48_020498 [Paspalum notatum var. saurae]|uniref:Helitron helicase-like domain-containing protein n=1 Tax=Paspalum notatum var. saurae TaxID=547442 RepID=A0AAQ3TF69_PASNO